MTPDDVTLEVALKLLSLPRELGEHPQLQQPVTAYNGRYGPYVKCGEETRSLPADLSPLDVTLPAGARAVGAAQDARTRSGRGQRAVEGVRQVARHAGARSGLLEGRYGPVRDRWHDERVAPQGCRSRATDV